MELNAITRWNSISTDLYKAHQLEKQRAAGKLKPGERLHIEPPKTGFTTKGQLFGSDNDLARQYSSNEPSRDEEAVESSTAGGKSLPGLREINNEELEVDQYVSTSSSSSDDEGGEEEVEHLSDGGSIKRKHSKQKPSVDSSRLTKEAQARIQAKLSQPLPDELSNEPPQSSTQRLKDKLPPVSGVIAARMHKLSESIEALKDEGQHNRQSMLLELIYRAAKRFMKGFTIAYIGKATLSFIGLLIKTRARLSKMRGGVSRIIVGDPVRYGIALGGYITLFESVIRLLRYYKGFSTSMSQRTLLAGGVAGVSFLAMPKDARTGISLFFFVRALEVLARYYSQKYPEVVPPVVQNNAAVLTMGVASAQLCWAWIFNRGSMETSYAYFFDNHGQRIKPKLDAICHLLGGPGPAYAEQKGRPPMPFSVAIDKIRQHCDKLGIAQPDLSLGHPRIQCHILHPEHESCQASFVFFFAEGMKRAIPVYLPVYLIPLLLFKAQVIFKRPIKTIVSTTTSVLRSSAFLATYCAIAMHSICYINRITGRNHHLAVAVSGFLGGSLGLKVERDSRQIELALYVLSHGVYSFYNTWRAKGVLPVVKHFETLLFMASTSTILWAYVSHPSTIRYSYFSLMRFLFGSGGKQERFIHAKGMSTKHVLSRHTTGKKPRVALKADQDLH